MREGFVLTAAFAELLPLYEKQPAAMKLYYPDLIRAIDVGKERKRLKNVEFLTSIPQQVIVPPPTTVQVSEGERSLQQAESLLSQHDLANSKKMFQRSLSRPTASQCTARPTSDLLRSRFRNTRPIRPRLLFQKVVELNSSPSTVAWSHVYLGRIAMLHDDSQNATDHLKKVLATDGAPDKAKEAAQNDLQKISGEQQQ